MKKKSTSNALINLGTNLQFICSRDCTSNKDFALKLNYDRILLSKLFIGTQNIKLSTANKIAYKTGYSLSALLSNSFKDDPKYRERELYIEIDTLELFLNFINEKMKENRVSQASICYYSGIDKAALSRLLSRNNINPTLKTMEKITQALGYELNIAFKEVIK